MPTVPRSHRVCAVLPFSLHTPTNAAVLERKHFATLSSFFDGYLLRIAIQFVQGKVRAKREQSEGKERVRRGAVLFTLSLPSLCPLSELSLHRKDAGGQGEGKDPDHQ